ncbi:MAG TPA: SRPBCC family protein [Gaiellaceae bacterium]|nr:SRPBCC family protein [Gaiellaceae bacterium]
MRIDNSFEVAADRGTVWELLMDVPRVVPCMPGAELVEEVDESTWRAKMAVKLGPISLSFATDVHRDEADAEVGRVRLSAKAREMRGRGAAQATIESTLSPVEGGTRVSIATELGLSGAVAQYGRGIVPDVTAQLVEQFAACLQGQLTAATPEQASAAVAAQAKPIGGIRLVLAALLRRLRPRRRGQELPAAGRSTE